LIILIILVEEYNSVADTHHQINYERNIPIPLRTATFSISGLCENIQRATQVPNIVKNLRLFIYNGITFNGMAAISIIVVSAMFIMNYPMELKVV
jgi:tetrahydromethanopterin S-methyltransferase subunit F